MVRLLVVHQTAQHLHELARDSELPGYAEKLERAAIDLEKLEDELMAQRSQRFAQPSSRDTSDLSTRGGPGTKARGQFHSDRQLRP